MLTHDPKFDVPLLEVALRRPAAYIGAMGSRRTHDDRLARLREVGLTEAELARLRSPIGLDLGARTPEETAVAIAAELIQLRWGGSGRPLTATTGRIHHGSASYCLTADVAARAARRRAERHVRERAPGSCLPPAREPGSASPRRSSRSAASRWHSAASALLRDGGAVRASWW